MRAVLDDVRAWRLLAETQFQRWADDPAGEVEPGVAMQDRLTARLADSFNWAQWQEARF